MALTINRKKEAHDCLQTSIGKLCIFSIDFKDKSELDKQLGRPLKDCTPEEFVKNLSVFVCYPEDKLKEGKYKPDTPILRIADANKLTTENLEKIADIYINSDDSLSKIHNEKAVAEDEKYKVKHHINDLHRLSILEDDRRKKQMEKILPQYGLDIFSTELVDRIKGTLFMGNSLNKKMESIRFMDQSQPFHKLADGLDQLIDLSAQATEFIIKANEIQTDIAAEIKTSGNATEKYSRLNIRLTIFVIGISIISLILTAYAIISGNSFNERQSSKIQNSADAIEASLSAINNNLLAENQNVQNSLDSVANQSKNFSSQQFIYVQLLEQNKTLINELMIVNNKQNIKIKELQRKIVEFENGRKLVK